MSFIGLRGWDKFNLVHTWKIQPIAHTDAHACPGRGHPLERKKKQCEEKKERMREEEICVGHKGIKGQLNNSVHIFQAGGGVLWVANEALYQPALRLCVSETSEGEELKPDSELIWRRERVCRQESRRLPWCLMCWVALRDHLELSLSQITAPHTPFTSSRWIFSLSHLT